MSLITRVEPQKRNKERFNVYVDGKYLFAVSLEVLTKFGLKKNKEISEEKIEEIVNEESYVKGFSKILDFISYQPRTTKEVKDKLNTYLYKSIKEERLREQLKSRIMERVLDLDLIDDLVFAKTYVKQKTESRKPLGLSKMREFLFKKGVNSQTINEALENYDENTQLKGAIFFAEKKLKSLRNEKPRKRKQKLWRYLSSKGYPSSVVSSAVDTVLKL